MRPDLRLLANHRAVDRIDNPARLPDQLRSMAEENAAVGALPLWVGRREMLADVAKAGGSEQGIGDRVEHDVGIAVACKSAVVGDLDPTDHHRTLAGKGVHVKAHA